MTAAVIETARVIAWARGLSSCTRPMAIWVMKPRKMTSTHLPI